MLQVPGLDKQFLRELIQFCTLEEQIASGVQMEVELKKSSPRAEDQMTLIDCYEESDFNGVLDLQRSAGDTGVAEPADEVKYE